MRAGCREGRVTWRSIEITYVIFALQKGQRESEREEVNLISRRIIYVTVLSSGGENAFFLYCAERILLPASFKWPSETGFNANHCLYN
jgi:hypothetical protein